MEIYLDLKRNPLPFLLTPSLLNKAQLRREDGELEKSCTRCGEFWPADLDFFYARATRRRRVSDGAVYYTLSSWCRGCHQEHWRVKHEADPPSWRIQICRKKRSTGVLVIVAYKGRHYAALYSPGADTSKSAVCRDLKERKFGRSKEALFKPFDPIAGRFASELEKLSKRFAVPAQRKPSADHAWRLADRRSYLLYHARHGEVA